MVKLKLVAGVSYSCGPVFGYDKVVQRGETVTVTEEHAVLLLNRTFLDALNNTHNYFMEVEGGQTAEAAEAAPAKAPKATRTRKAAAADKE